MAEFTVLFRGAPIGTLRAKLAGALCGGNLTPLPGFDAVRSTIADASRALANYGFLPAAGEIAGEVSDQASAAGEAAFAAAQALSNQLELRDARGQLVHTDWINVFGGRTPEDSIAVMAALHQAPSATPASLTEPRRADSGTEPPAG
jgi:hypothetical protein